MTAYLITLIGSVWAYRAILCYGFNVDQSYLYAAFDTRLDQLMIGCLLAVLLKRKTLTSFWQKVSAHPLLPLITITLILISIFVGNAYVHRYRDVFGFALEPLLMAILIIQLIPLSSTPLWSWTEWRAIKFLGTISYSLYLYQQLTLHPVKERLTAYPVIVQLLGAISVTILVAAASYFIVERPFLRLKNKQFKFRRRPQINRVTEQ